MKSLRQVAKELNISVSYLSDILNGKKGCNEELMNKIKEYYPYLEFYIFTKPRYKVLNNLGDDDCELDKIRDNKAYINDKRYFGLDRELLSYIRKLERALDEIEKILNGVGEMACYSKSMCLYEEDIEDILKIIQKAKGDVKNENNNI